MLTGSPLSEFLRFTIPSAIGLCAISSAGIIDGIFVSRFVGTTALAAVNLTLPFLSLFFGLIIMVTTGAAMIVGSHLGADDADAASKIFTQSLSLVLAISLVFALVACLVPMGLAGLLGAPESLQALLGVYLRLLGLSCPFLGLAFALSQYLRLDGEPNRALVALLLITIFKVLLDYLLIVHLSWGLFGAGLATGLAHLISVFYMLPHFLARRGSLHLTLPTGPWTVLPRAMANGFSEFVNEISGGIIVFTFNWILVLEAGTKGVAAFTVVNCLVFFGIMLFYGVSEGLSSLISVNHGAGNRPRILRFLGLGLASSFLLGLFMAALLLLVPVSMTGLFLRGAEGGTIRLSLRIIATIWPLFLFAGSNIVFSGYFTAMQRPGPSAMISLSRSLLLPLCLALSLWNLLGFESIFYALPLSEALTFALCLLLFFRDAPDPDGRLQEQLEAI